MLDAELRGLLVRDYDGYDCLLQKRKHHRCFKLGELLSIADTELVAGCERGDIVATF
jgi:hypothetical protein